MELADLLEHEQVHVLDIDNGARFETYVMRGGPGDVILNGAAARLVHTGDRVIVITYAQYDEAELESYAPEDRARRLAQPPHRRGVPGARPGVARARAMTGQRRRSPIALSGPTGATTSSQ